MDWVLNITELLLSATERGTTAAQEVLPHTTAQQILEALYEIVRKEPTVVDVSRGPSQCNVIVSAALPDNLTKCVQVVPSMPDTAVIVVGDTHGQLHDVCSM